MTKAIFRVSKLELENLLQNQFVLLIVAIYTLFILAVSVSKELQTSYFSVIASLPIMLVNFVLPLFLVLIVCIALLPVYAGETERNTNQIPAACYLGRKGRSMAKIIASVTFSFSVSLYFCLTTWLICFLMGHFADAKETTIQYINDGIKLDFTWNIWQHFGFAVCCLLIGAVILSIFVLFLSCLSKNTITALGITMIMLLFEFLFHRFSFPLIWREYNIWVFFRPYYLYILNIFSFSPCFNLFLLTVIFLPLCIAAIWNIIQRGG